MFQPRGSIARTLRCTYCDVVKRMDSGCFIFAPLRGGGREERGRRREREKKDRDREQAKKLTY